IVTMIQGRGAMVVLVEVKTGYIAEGYTKDLKRLAKKKGALLVPNILRGIFFDPSFKSDMIHPNDAGYHLIAERIYKAIKPLLR
ncbi:MAG: arylesterase, partial [Candidatus Omnitrophica bacterium]|nr:arylesterase [Candidatus Omnitrophota bacterium]